MDERVRQPQRTKQKDLTGKQIAAETVEQLRAKWPELAAFIEGVQATSEQAHPAAGHVALLARVTREKGAPTLRGPAAEYVAQFFNGRLVSR